MNGQITGSAVRVTVASFLSLQSLHCGSLVITELILLQLGPGAIGQGRRVQVGGAGASLHTLHSLHCGPLGNTEPIFLQFGPGAGGQPILVQRTRGTTGTGAGGLVIYKQS